MKLLGAILLVLLLTSVTANAQTAALEQSTGGATLGELIGKLTHRSGDLGARKPKVIGLDASDSSLVFAAAGSVQGAGGTYFRSDVTLINYRSVSQRVAVGWIAQGVDNSAAPLQYITLDANTPHIFHDFVSATLGKSGLGAIFITGVLSNGDLDSSAKLDGYSRIWTPQPGASGSVSQGFPSVAVADSIGTLTAYAAGNRHDSQFRSNAGVVNLDSAAHDWTVHVNGLLGERTFTVSVPAISMKQVAVPAGTYGDFVLSFQTNAAGIFWSAYGASVDNVSGDSWSSHAAQP